MQLEQLKPEASLAERQEEFQALSILASWQGATTNRSLAEMGERGEMRQDQMARPQNANREGKNTVPF